MFPCLSGLTLCYSEDLYTNRQQTISKSVHRPSGVNTVVKMNDNINLTQPVTSNVT